MLLDFLDFENGRQIDCDVCIVGAGAAGITLASSLIGTGIRVCLLESGGLEASREIQSLYEGQRVGLENANPVACRLRYFGGTTNHWAGWCAPLSEADFEPRPWVPLSGWPIRRVDLDPYYERAQAFCQIGDFGFDAKALLDDGRRLPAFDADKAVVRFFRFSPPTRLGTVYRERLQKADNVRVILHANVLRLEPGPAAHEVRKVQLRSLDGKSGTVNARTVVLACGAMENARLLLLSGPNERTGLGNESGLVGRCFMQHVEITVADILVTRPAELAGFAKYTKDGVGILPEMSIAKPAQHKHGIMSSGFAIEKYSGRANRNRALRVIWGDLKKGNWPDNFAEKLRRVLADLAPFGGSEGVDDKSMASLRVRAEQQPDMNSRISLGDQRDALGQPRIKVDWRLTRFDKRSIREATLRVAEEFGRLNIGRLQLEDWLLQDDDFWPQPVWGGCHHLGTTRMSDDAATGVVDRNCRMHSVGNLYVAGSSVFPTGGYVPPTLTIVALALRLADHLKLQLQARKSA